MLLGRPAGNREAISKSPLFRGESRARSRSWIGQVYTREERNARLELEKFACFELGARWRAQRGEGERQAGDALAW